MNVMGISLSGLQASMARMSASAANVANVNSRGAAPAEAREDGGAAPAPAPYQPIRAQSSPVAGGGVTTRYVAAEPGYTLAYDPTASYANAQGMVASPNVDLMTEMVEQMGAALAFKANAKIIGTMNDLEQRSIERWG